MTQNVTENGSENENGERKSQEPSATSSIESTTQTEVITTNTNIIVGSEMSQNAAQHSENAENQQLNVYENGQERNKQEITNNTVKQIGNNKTLRKRTITNEQGLQAILKDKLYHAGFIYKHNTLALTGKRVGAGVRVGEMMDMYENSN